MLNAALFHSLAENHSGFHGITWKRDGSRYSSVVSSLLSSSSFVSLLLSTTRSTTASASLSSASFSDAIPTATILDTSFDIHMVTWEHLKKSIGMQHRAISVQSFSVFSSHRLDASNPSGTGRTATTFPIRVPDATCRT